MRVGLAWLSELVDVTLPADELAHRLDMSGTKVEAIHRPGGEVSGVVVAEVLEIVPHPNADNLTLVEVEVGTGATQRVVCGARNFEVGDRVPLARVGARLPEMEITERKIRGEVSRGMLCSAAELGVSRDHSGILVLQPDAPVGEDVVDLLGLDDVILELEVTPNRPDCMSMIGIAREVAALTGAELNVPQPTGESDDIAAAVSVEISDPDGCPRYLARYLENVKVAPAPGWMARRLFAAGVRPISNVVDVTNYVLMETGHPLHAFDAERVHDGTIVVRRARDGEIFRTLDGTQRTLHPDDLLIADPARPLALAGVMGGLDSEVGPSTARVILESAYFDPTWIAFTSRRHQLRTEASARFERGADIEMVPHAAARAAELMREIAGGELSGAEVDTYPRPRERVVVALRPERTARVLGLDIPPDNQAAHLRAIGLEVAEEENSLRVEVPSFRPDLEREADLIEEVARLEGFDRIPATVPTGPAGGLSEEQRAERTLKRALAVLGVTEAWTSSFRSEGELDALGLDESHPARLTVDLANPTVDPEPGLRTTLMPGLLRAAARNVASHRPAGGALFEIARTYRPAGDLADEEVALAAVFWGERRPPSWAAPAEAWDVFGAKHVIVTALRLIGVAGARFEPTSGAPFHPTRAAHLQLEGHPLGVVGEVHPEVCARFDVPERTVLLEVALAPVLERLPGRAKAADIPRFPSTFLDLAVVVDAGVASAKVEDVITRAAGSQLRDLRLFDLYRGDQVAEGKKSLAFALELGSSERTLTDEDALAIRDRVVNALRERVGADLRA